MGSMLRAGIVTALLALAGCADAPITVRSYDPSYNPGEPLAAGSALPVVVRGNPFPIPDAEFASDVVDAMQGWAFVPIHFVPASDVDAVYRVVMVFNPPNVTGAELCRRPLTVQPLPATTVAPPTALQTFAGAGWPSRVPLIAALCRGEKDLAYVFGSVPTDDGPRSEAFRRGLGEFVAGLFPPHNPEQERRRLFLR